MSKHILVVHGFLLSGTGSNIYSCNVAKQWKKQNHAVTIFCQDPDAGSYDWVDEFFTKNVRYIRFLFLSMNLYLVSNFEITYCSFISGWASTRANSTW